MVRRELGSADVWLGLTDAAVEDSWVDASGAPAPYLGFTGREPTGGASENCAVLDTGTAGGWRDTSCDALDSAACRDRGRACYPAGVQPSDTSPAMAAKQLEFARAAGARTPCNSLDSRPR